MSLAVLALIPHPPAGASGRYRVYDLKPELARHGVDLDIRPFLDTRALARLYRPGAEAAKAWDLAHGAWGRWRDLGRADRYAAVLVHREVWPLAMRAPERRLARRQPRFVYDFDDAVFLPNVSEANRRFARLKPFDQPARLAAGARAVAAGNAWLAAWARGQRGGRPEDDVQVVPTAVDTARWSPRPRDAGPPRLVWIGGHSTVRYLEPLRPVLKRLGARHPALELHVIGAEFAAEGVRVVTHPWDAATEVDLVARGDVGLAPLDDSDWSRGKCGLKLLLYMSLGLATVASPFGVHPTMVEDGVHGLLASDADALERALERLLVDQDLRARLGAAARARVEAEYSLRAVAPRLAALLHRAAGDA